MKCSRRDYATYRVTSQPFDVEFYQTKRFSSNLLLRPPNATIWSKRILNKIN